VTYPQDPYGYGPFSYDPLGRMPPAAPPVQPPAFAPPPPPPPPAPRPHRRPVNSLAALSLVSAFVFPPAGAVLGHLGLARIRRTGEPGRGLALAGMTLSYAFIALAVVAVVAWTTLAPFRAPPSRTAASPTAAAPPGPTVEPASIATLLPSLDTLKNITGDQNLELGPTRDRAARSGADGSIDRPQCWGSIAAGSPDAYTVDAITGYHAAKFVDTRSMFKSVEVLLTVIAFRDAPTAQSQLANALSGWRQCGGSTVTATFPNDPPIQYSLGDPTAADNGITTLDLVPKVFQIRSTRAIAAKANVVIDLAVTDGGTTDATRPHQAAVSVANYVLEKIPG
jgi:eukaryotic-like serine/threonine-protein kinase